jgi:hypothetical protein
LHIKNQKLKIPNGSTTTPSKTNPSTNNNVGGSGGYSSPTFRPSAAALPAQYFASDQ